MPRIQILINDVPTELHRKVKVRAKENHRTLAKQALSDLEEQYKNTPLGPTITPAKKKGKA